MGNVLHDILFWSKIDYLRLALGVVHLASWSGCSDRTNKHLGNVGTAGAGQQRYWLGGFTRLTNEGEG